MYIFVQKTAVPRTATVFSAKDLNSLKTYIEKIFGRSVVQQSDCIVLSDLVYEKTNQLVSPQTIRRFFNLIKTVSNPSIFTLNAFCNFCGFDDWKHFINRNSDKQKKYLQSDQNGLDIQADILASFFKFNQDEWKDNNFFRSVREITKRIYSNPALANLLWERLAKNPVSQKWVFEFSPDMNGLARSFRDGVTSYLRYKTDQQAIVYGHSLLFLGAFLSENKNLINKEYGIINSLAIDDRVHSLPLARQLGTHLLYHSVNRNYTEQRKWADLITGKYLKYFVHETNSSSTIFPGYHFMAANYLLLGHFYHDAFLVLDEYMLKVNQINSNHHSYDQLEALKLMYAIAKAHDNNEAAAKVILQQIQPETMCFLHREYFMIRYFLLQLHFTGSAALIKKNKLKAEIEKLIDNTGYIYFEHELKKYF